MSAAEIWLEEQYREFEEHFLSRCKYWRAPAQTLVGTKVHDVFTLFQRTFPDHPSDTNTVFYLIESVNRAPSSHQIWLWCNHFEHHSLEALRDLTVFMGRAMRDLSTSLDCARIEMLDAFRERVVLSFSFPNDASIKTLKERGLENQTSLSKQ